MASKKIKGITIEIGGDTTKLGKALESSEKHSRDLQTELREVNKLLKFDPSNTELLAQKQKILTGQIKETSDRLDILKKAQDQVVEAFERGEASEEQVRALQREIIATKSKLDSYKNALNNTNAELKKMDGNTSETISAIDKLNSEISSQEAELTQLKGEYANLVLEQKDSSKEAKELEDKMKKLNDELKENKKKLNEAEKEAGQFADSLDDAGDSADDSSGGFTIMKGALADLTANAIQGCISAIGDMIGALLELSEATEEYRQMQGKLEGSANTFGYSVDFASSKYKDFYKYLGDDQMATNAVTNLMGLGTSTESVSNLANAAIGVWSAYGDSIPIEGLTEAMNETAQVGKVTGSLADALNWAGISEDKFNEKLEKCKTTQERADLIAKTLNDTYGESKKTYDELNGSITEANEAELKLKDTQAELGAAVEPVNTAMTNLKAQALEAIAPLVKNVSDAFLDMLNWLKEHPGAMKALTAIIIALAAAFTILAGALAIQGIITGVTKAIAFLNTTILANPIVLIVAAIAGLVAAFIYLWNTCDGFREFFINLWEVIKSSCKIAIDAIVKFFTQTVPNAWNKFISFCSNFISKVVSFFSQLPGKIWTHLTNVISRIATWGSNMTSKAVSAVTNLVNKVVTWFKGLPGKISSAISSAISNIASWGNNVKNKAVSAVKSMVSNVFNTAKQIPGKIKSAIQGAISAIGSWGSSMLSKAKSAISNVANAIKSGLSSVPSKMLSIGKNIVQGLWNGINNAKDWVLGKIKGFGNSILSGIKSFFGIKSPSTLFRDEVGKFLAEGISVGITANADKPITALHNVGQDMLDEAQGINGVTLNRQLETTFNSTLNTGSIADLVRLVAEYMPKLIEASQHAIVLDSGALVGETVQQYDAALGDLYALRGRGM